MSEMNEHSDSLTSALSKARFPAENHGFIRQFTESLGITRFHFKDASERYIAAVRRDGLPDLRIFSGYTIGFASEEEARRVGAGADTIRESFKADGRWLVSHPVHGDLDRRSGGPGKKRRDPRLCPNGCGEELPLTGICDNCGP